jgi:hypothetical protein
MEGTAAPILSQLSARLTVTAAEANRCLVYGSMREFQKPTTYTLGRPEDSDPRSPADSRGFVVTPWS